MFSLDSRFDLVSVLRIVIRWACYLIASAGLAFAVWLAAVAVLSL